LLNGEYAKFEVKAADNAEESDKGLNISNEFITTVIEQNMRAFTQQAGSLVTLAVEALILVLVPGGQIIDNIAVGLMGRSTFGTDRITSKKENIKTRARLQIKIQKNTMVRDIAALGQKINKESKKQIEEVFSEKQTEADRKREVYRDAFNHLEEFLKVLNEYVCESEDY
jgi:hypothetical protein